MNLTTNGPTPRTIGTKNKVQRKQVMAARPPRVDLRPRANRAMPATSPIGVSKLTSACQGSESRSRLGRLRLLPCGLNRDIRLASALATKSEIEADFYCVRVAVGFRIAREQHASERLVRVFDSIRDDVAFGVVLSVDRHAVLIERNCQARY